MSADYNKKFLKFMNHMGMKIIGSGGGCDAFVFKRNAVLTFEGKDAEPLSDYELITCNDGGNAPEGFLDRVVVGKYDENGDPMEDVCREYETLEEYIFKFWGKEYVWESLEHAGLI